MCDYFQKALLSVLTIKIGVQPTGRAAHAVHSTAACIAKQDGGVGETLSAGTRTAARQVEDT